MNKTMASHKQSLLYQEAMVRLAELIQKGKFRPGDRLPPERTLAAEMKISRATLREALRVMQLQGIIESRHGAGNYIAGGNPQDLAFALNQLALRDIFELRLLIEPSIAALAAQRATPEDISKLEKIVRKQKQQLARNKMAAETDAEFHAALADATHNQGLVQISTTLMQVSAPSRIRLLQSPQRAQSSLTYHDAILDAIRACDPPRAQNEMEQHVQSVNQALFGLPKHSLVVSIPNRKEVVA